LAEPQDHEHRHDAADHLRPVSISSLSRRWRSSHAGGSPGRRGGVSRAARVDSSRHAQDLEDVDALLRLGLVQPTRLCELYAQIEPELYRFPAIDPAQFREAVAAVTKA